MKLPVIVRFVISCTLWISGSCQTSSVTAQPTVKPHILPPTIHPRWKGCVGNANMPANVVKGQPTLVCFTIGPLGNWDDGANVMRYSFKPTADQYSRFSIPNSYRDFVLSKTLPNFTGNLTVFTASQTAVSYLRLYHDATNKLIYPYLTAIIDVSTGVVNGITYDDSCVFCGSNKCQENTYDFFGNSTVEGSKSGLGPTKGCYYTTAECDLIFAKNGTQCDLSIYVTWTGTDSTNKPLFSTSSRYSAFSQQSVYNQLSGGLKKLLGSNWVSTILG